MIEGQSPTDRLNEQVGATSLLRATRFLPRWLALRAMAKNHPAWRVQRETVGYAVSPTIVHWFDQFVFSEADRAYWPVDRTSKIVNWRNIRVGIDSAPGFMPNCYIQGIGLIDIGDYVWIAPGVHIISANHDIHDHRQHSPTKVTIGRHSWLGGGAKVMPGVELGPFTIVAAGAVVTRSFPEGYQILAGVPAKPVRRIEREQCVDYSREHRYHGYIPVEDFPEFSRLALHSELLDC
ncbi:acyltransferase [Sphingopyxis sp. PET50]|uniref:acyltransferase n=1 Tax=Sphingopyxis sp. PET50 TaxID=2976533 RepID=UPI0021B0700F|nr:acyltransferase [Sphingopyxis sp. PET50]